MTWCNTGNGRRDLRNLGECEVKHGVRLHLVNLYAETVGQSGSAGEIPAGQRMAQTALQPGRPAETNALVVIDHLRLHLPRDRCVIFAAAVMKSLSRRAQ